jgi:hypothetical protein
MTWGVGVWSEVGVLINPTGFLWDSGQDSGLGSSFLEPYCPQQTLIFGRERCHADTENRYHRNGFLQYATGQNVLVVSCV